MLMSHLVTNERLPAAMMTVLVGTVQMSGKRWLSKGLIALCIVLVLAWWAALARGAVEALF
jgi:hypothetical protein